MSVRSPGEGPPWVLRGLGLGVLLVFGSMALQALSGVVPRWLLALAIPLGLLGFGTFAVFGIVYLGFYTVGMMNHLFGEGK